jgi:hypothetical protein
MYKKHYNTKEEEKNQTQEIEFSKGILFFRKLMMEQKWKLILVLFDDSFCAPRSSQA